MRSPDNRVWGEVQKQIKVYAVDTTLVIGDTGIVPVDTSGGNRVMTLPTAADSDGLAFYFHNRSTNRLTVTPAGTDTIDGVNAPHFSDTNYASYCIYSDGVEWFTCGFGTWTT